jgi:epoxyqueuosine reductase
MQKALEAVFADADFDLVGVLPIGESQTAETLDKWLKDGKHGNMQWMAREDAVAKRHDARKILPGAQSVISLAWKYTPPEIPDELLNDPSRGIIARYALYDDYHDVIKKALHRFAEALQKELGAFEYKAYVDTGPFLEREWANRAGIGYIGRNSNLIHYEMGSYLFLAELLVTADLEPYKQRVIGSCGSCTNCVSKCPTGAILDNRTIDARKCISYLTIEHKGAIPKHLRPLMRNRLYGCDICQEVCPWNRKPSAQQKTNFTVREDLVAPPLQDLLFFDDKSFRERFRKSPIKRAKREGFMRNVAVALGNWGTPDAHKLLDDILKNDESELVREHAQWGKKRVPPLAINQ